MCVLITRETPPLNGRQPKLQDEPPLKTVMGMRSASQYCTIFCTSCLSRGCTTTSAHLADDALAELQNLLGGLGRGVFNAAVVVQGHIFLAHDGRKRLDLSGFERRRAVQNHRVMPLILLVLRNRHRSSGIPRFIILTQASLGCLK